MVTMEKFEKDLRRKGCGEAPNGATYKMTTWGTLDIPAFTEEKHGHREIFVGFSGEQFESMEGALHFALAIGRHEYQDSEHKMPLSDRKLVA